MKYQQFTSGGNATLSNVLEKAMETSNNAYVTSIMNDLSRIQLEKLEDLKRTWGKIPCPHCGKLCKRWYRGNYTRKLKTDRGNGETNLKIVYYTCDCEECAGKRVRHIPFLQDLGIDPYKHYRSLSNAMLSTIVSMTSYWNTKDILGTMLNKIVWKKRLHRRVNDYVKKVNYAIENSWVLLVDGVYVRNKQGQAKEIYSASIVYGKAVSEDGKPVFQKQNIGTFETLEQLAEKIQSSNMTLYGIILDGDGNLEKLAKQLQIDEKKIYRCEWHLQRNSLFYMKYFDKKGSEKSKDYHKKNIIPLIKRTTRKGSSIGKSEWNDLFKDMKNQWYIKAATYLENGLQWLTNHGDNPICFEDESGKLAYLRSTSPQERENRITKERTRIGCRNHSNVCALLSHKQEFCNQKRKSNYKKTHTIKKIVCMHT